ncbi:MAG: DNA translocase FtsK 4TM domain-containing protein [Patescibacteria group bacterium]
MFGSRKRRSSKKTSSPRKRKSSFRLQLHSQVARDIWALLYGSFAVLLILSLKGAFGLVGDLFIGLLQPILGWGIYVIPGFFGLISLMLFFSKTVSFGFTRVLGIFMLFLSVLSIFHLSVPISDLYAVADQGQYGGYTGFVTNFLFRQVLHVGHVGATVVFLTIFFVGVLLTFNISLRQLFAFLSGGVSLKRVKVRSGNDEEDDDLEEEPAILIRRSTISEDDMKDVPVEDEEIEHTEEEQEPRVVSFQPAAKTTSGPVKSGTAKKKEDEEPWEFPSLDLLSPPAKSVAMDADLLMEYAEKIKNKLKQFGIQVGMHEVNVGPTVVQYTLRPDEGVKLSKILSLKNDIALALAAKSVRIEAPIPGKSLVGIEVPNENRVNVHLREILDSKEFSGVDSKLRLPLGRDVSGKPVVGDLSSMPHLLIAGSTGSGKSVGMNAFLISLLYQNSPSELKMIMIDPKRVELNFYNGIPHLLTPVITEPEKAAIALRWAVSEMTRRYQMLSEKHHRNLADYNNDDAIEEKLPRIVIVIDELADLMMVAKSEVEASVCRIAQMARAVGMHLIVATQRPSVDVITGLIKANIPSRIAYAVSSSIDSRTILDGIGAEDLLGRGDMLYMPSGMNKPQRIQGVYLSTAELERVTNNVKIMCEPDYLDEVTSRNTAAVRVQGVPESVFSNGEETDDETLLKNALQLVVESRKASASLLQRRLKVGYARAARLLDLMEERGWIGPSQGAKAREIYYQGATTVESDGEM